LQKCFLKGGGEVIEFYAGQKTFREGDIFRGQEEVYSYEQSTSTRKSDVIGFRSGRLDAHEDLIAGAG
jgi:hypothetical protein